MTLDDTTQIRELKLVLPRVLIVDDNPTSAAKLKELISAAGFYVDAAGSGAAALLALRDDFAPIVVLDHKTPQLDGLSVCQAIRQQSFPGYVYVIVLTAQDTEADVLNGLDAGADDYVSKRASSAQLIARLRAAERIVGLDQTLRAKLDEKNQQAMTDAVTGVPNRAYLMRHLRRELKTAQRSGGKLCLLMLAVDHFKQIDDKHGRAVGEEVLREAARRLAVGLPRESDWFAQLGSKEFAVVLPQTPLTGAQLVAERLRRLISQRAMTTRSGDLAVTVSIGVAGVESLPTAHASSVERLTELASQCLAAGVEAGCDRVTSAVPASGQPS
jgi:two-component system, cell cycle response regulator